MIVKKKINNNFAICVDSNNQEIIAYGKGIGFRKTPYELSDLSEIDRTFYNVNNYIVNLVNQLPESVFAVSIKIMDLALQSLDDQFTQNMILSLADHINYAIERKRSGKLAVVSPLGRNIQYLYKRELEIGMKSLEIIKDDLGVLLPEQEASNIAVHFIVAEADSAKEENEAKNRETIISNVTQIIENELNIVIDRNSINYSRFVIHLEYLLINKNSKNNEPSRIDAEFIRSTINEYPDIHKVAISVSNYINLIFNCTTDDEEILYLMLHINRLENRVKPQL